MLTFHDSNTPKGVFIMLKRFFPFLFLFFIVSFPGHGSGYVHKESHFIDADNYMEDGTKIRTAFLPAKTDREIRDSKRNVVIFIHGVTSCVENNMDLAYRLSGYAGDKSTTNPCDFWAMDLRGHGQSGGRLPGSQRAHVNSFDEYISDLHEILQKRILPYYNEKGLYENEDFIVSFLAMSMGGNVAIRYLQEHAMDTASFKQCVLLSPMVKIRWHLPEILTNGGLDEKAIHLTTKIAGLLNYGTYSMLTQSDRDMSVDTEEHPGCHDPEDYKSQQAFFRRHPDRITGGVTVKWAEAAIDSINRLHEMKKCAISITAFLAGQDHAVDSAAAAHFLSRFQTTIHTYPESYHNITREPDAYAPGFWKALYALFPESAT